MASDLLFELGTEELPSGAVWPLAKELGHHLSEQFKNAGLTFSEIHHFASPRRLAIWVEELLDKQPSQTISRKGPAVAVGFDSEGKPTKALLGFARSCGVEVSALSQTETDKGAWWTYEAHQSGAETVTIIPDMIQQAVVSLTIPKPMRWGSGDEGFARPVHWSVLLYGHDVVETSVLGVKTGRDSYGHRFHHPQAVSIPTPDVYEALMDKVYVLADFQKRRELIKEKVTKLAAQHHLIPVMPDDLLDEVTSIVEWPNPLLAQFESEFLTVPAEALIASMQSHQKCFALRNEAGELQPCFITVSNINSDAPEQVVAGNEKVMRARLSDAAFFFNQDKKKPLEDYIQATEKVKFQDRLGSLKDKASRMEGMMSHLVHPLSLDNEQASRACRLSKSDLMTGMVGEFPELQGLMGYYYALNDEEAEPLAQALYEQYLPRYSGDELPQTNLGLALSLADRIDTLVGIFGIGQKPSGVKDPFKLRRHAMAIVRLLIATDAELKLSSLISDSKQTFKSECQLNQEAITQLKPYILERMQSHYQNQGIPSEVVYAVRARQDEWLNDVDKRIQALLTFIQLPEAASLSAACKRVNNILQKSQFSDDNEEVNPELFQQAEEKDLLELIHSVEDHTTPLFLKGAYQEILTTLAKLKNPVDNFFEQVMVMVEDTKIQENRLRLLHRLQDALQGVADISLLNIEK